MPTPIYVSWDKREGRIQASICIASYLAVDDAIVGLLERDFPDDDDAIDHAEYDDDEIYEAITGEQAPDGMYAYFHEGDLFLGAHVDLDADADQDERDEVWAEFKADLLKAGFVPEWLTAEDAV